VTQFDGIIELQDTTNQNDLDGASSYMGLMLKIQCKALSMMVVGQNSQVASSSVVTDLRKIMIDTFNFRPSDLVGGVKLPFGIPQC